MSSVNKVILVGRVGKDPEVREFGGGNSVCNFSIATSETWNDKSGEKQERTEWHNVSSWGRTGENCAKFLKKGSMVYVEGKLESSERERDGVNMRYWNVRASNVTFLPSKTQDGDTHHLDDGGPIPF